MPRLAPVTIHELHIKLIGSRPPIFRRVAVPSDLTLGDLHVVIQIAMGWQNSHMHQFILRPKRPRNALNSGMAGKTPEKGAARPLRYKVAPPTELYFGSADYPDMGMEMGDEEKTRLCQVCPAVKDKIEYEYDFGDSWSHEVVVKKIYSPKPEHSYPACLDGGRACPLEDCGGIWGYYNLIDILNDPKHPEHEQYIEWTGGPIAPDEFGLDGVNRQLRSAFGPRPKRSRSPKD